MKKITSLVVALASVIMLSSCGVNSALTLNHNQNSTQVHLNSNNFKVVDHVSGSSEVKYIFLIGGAKMKQLYENANADMMKKAGLLNTSRALINTVTEEHVGGFPPFYFKRTVTVSSHVIEFTK